MNILIILLTAVIIDILIGELPSKIHPVVLMGNLIVYLKSSLSVHNHKFTGILITGITLMIFIALFTIIIKISAINYYLYIIISGLLLSTTFATRSLIDSVNQIKTDLNISLDRAKNSMSYLVSRNTSNLNESEIISAAIETLTENITDSITSPIIYTYIFGVLGAVSYRVINTLDAMVGYKTPENINIGWFPAKVDDLLNYIPARITGIIIVLSALILRLDWKNSYKIMIRDARNTPSPNSGYTMAAAAGALGIKLEKPGYYQIGDNINPLKIETITQAINLTKITVFLFLILSILLYIIFIILIMSWIK
jgi:adenosylcobinamide-phosphate synthase